jgi:hypothetical protein
MMTIQNKYSLSFFPCCCNLIPLLPFFSLLIQVMQMFTMASLSASQPLPTVVIEEEDDIQFIFQIDCFDL